MLGIVLIVFIVLLVIVVIILGMWGTATAATGATLAVSNGALAFSNAALALNNTTAQLTISFLSCVFVLGLPFILLGVFYLGKLVSERKQWRVENLPSVPRITSQVTQYRTRSDAPMIQSSDVPQLPAPRIDGQDVTPFYAPVMKRTATRTQRVRGAMQIAKRWWK